LMAIESGSRIEYRNYLSSPGRPKLPGGRRSSVPTAPRPDLRLPEFAAKVVLVKVAANFRPVEEEKLAETLRGRDLLAEVQLNHLCVSKVVGPEIRAVYIGGHLNACLDNQLAALPMLPMLGKRAEVFLPLDLIYLGPEDFQPETKRAAQGAKWDYFLGRRSKLFVNLDLNTSLDYAIFHNEQLVEARGREAVELPNALVLRVFASAKKMLNYLQGTTKE
jgi:hypothetical protein